MRQLSLRMFFCLLFWQCSCASEPSLPGQGIAMTAVSITDGDTFVGRSGGETYKIRLQGIDAPERGQDFSKRSKEYLGELCRQSPLRVRLLYKDGFGRWVADVFDVSGKHINAEMVAAGMAWHFRRYSNDLRLSKLEQQARSHRKGLWSALDPQPPWEYRSEKRARRNRP